MPNRNSLKINVDPPLNAKPRRFLSLGLGVQSSTILFLIEHGLVEPVDVALFADTRHESTATYEWLAYLKQTIKKTDIRVVDAGDLLEVQTTPKINKKTKKPYYRRLIPLFVHGTQKGKIGRIQTRGCSLEFKRKPLMRIQKELSGARYGQNWVAADVLFGISTDEASRMRDSDVPWIRNCYPLIDLNMSRQDCIKWLEDKKIPIPPRSSCIFCPFHTLDEWRELIATEKGRLIEAEQKIKKIDQRLSFTKKALTIPELEKKLFEPEQKGLSEWIGECTGYCGN